MRKFAIVAVGLVVGLALLLLMADMQFRRQIGDATAEIAAPPTTEDATAGEVDLANLPPLVLAFARKARDEIDCSERTITLTQRAEMLVGAGDDWRVLDATHVAATHASAFIWSADIDMLPLPGAQVRVVDALVNGEGRLMARLFGIIPLADAHGPEVATGQALRYLAEIPWNPAAILCNANLTWRELDATSIEVATETDGGVARLTLRFDTAGDIVAIAADARPRDEAGEMVDRPWRGRFGDYREIDGWRLPAFGEVGWVIDGRERPYFLGEILAVNASEAP